MLISVIAIIGVLVLAYVLVVNFYPSFGGDLTKERQELYTDSEQFKEGKFLNTNTAIPKDFSFSELLKISKKFFFEKVPNGRPKADLEVSKLSKDEVTNYSGPSRMVWYGHSAFLLQTQKLNILIDPMFGQVAAPMGFLGDKRFNTAMPLTIDELPFIDAVIISHDHYDHLDYESIKKLKAKVGHFYVPLGVGMHLEAWDIPKAAITEMDWWEATTFKGLQLVCTPAQHFSGRKFGKNQTTLWASWVIKTTEENIYFSGDSGYAPHFKEIGERYGPFDIALMECGQYNQMWAEIHMMPEETALAGVDVKAKTIMPIHWAGFKLALHSWTDPIERVTAKAEELELPMITPQIGEPFIVNSQKTNKVEWWSGL